MTDSYAQEHGDAPPSSPPTFETAGTVEGTDEGTGKGKMGGGNDPAEMGRKSGEARRNRSTIPDDPYERDETVFLRKHVARQEAIALGKGKPVPTSAMQTAAGKEAREARARLVAIEHASDSKGFDLTQLTDRLDVLRHVVGADEAQLQRLRDVIEGEGE